MNRKVSKIVISIILFILVLFLENNIYAITQTFEPQRGWQHADIWNNNHAEFLSYLLRNPNTTTKNITNGKSVTQTLELVLCRQKGGAIRFTPNPIPQDKDWAFVSESGWWCKEQTSCQNSTAATQIETGIRNLVKSTVENAIKADDSYKASTEVGGIYANYVGSTFRQPSVLGDWSGKTYYSDFVYTIVPTYTKDGSIKNATNKIQQYIMSAGADFEPTKMGFEQGNYEPGISAEADYQLIQDALWIKDAGFNIGNNYNAPDKAIQLYQEALEYKNYYKNVLSKQYKKSVSVDNSLSQVIVNRDKEEYILGPFKIKYPDQNPFSYIEEMYIVAENRPEEIKKTLKEGDFTILDENGNSRKYPSSEEYFYVKFNAEKAGYPTVAEVKVKFAYLASCSASYQRYNGKGEIWQVRGEYKEDVCGTHEYPYNEEVLVGYDEETGDPIYDYIPRVAEHDSYSYKYRIYKKYIGKYNAQKLAILAERKREWKRYEVDVTPSGGMNLTIELGGYVWEDKKAQKETGNDNIYNKNTENRIPNITVTLYKEDGTKVKLDEKAKPITYKTKQTKNVTKTSSKEETKGEYYFTGLNAMYQYYVEFTYNSQYYEPVKYVTPNRKNNAAGWGTDGWKTNSNGTDVRNERKQINVKFASIGSSPNNYESSNSTGYLVKSQDGKYYNQTFSKNDLLGMTLQADGTYKKTGQAVIDEFGNLILEKSDDATLRKKIQYVKDCQLNSYTGEDIEQRDANGKVKLDKDGEIKYKRNNTLYPIDDIFVIDKKETDDKKYKLEEIEILDNKTGETKAENILGKKFYKKIKVLYENDANKYINQGYTARQEAHIIVQKEVQKVVLEINGQEHTYKYDQIYKNKENKNSADYDNYWTVPERLQKGYYYMGPNDLRERFYTREIYESDYLYKVDMYGTDQKQEELGKKKSDELEVYVTYRIMINNSSQSIRTRIDELVDYYDEDFEFVPDRSYMKIQKGVDTTDIYRYDLNYSYKNEIKRQYDNTKNTESRYGKDTEIDIEGYNKLYISKIGNNANLIDGDSSKLETNNASDGMYLNSGDTANVFLTFKVKKDDQRNVFIDEYNNQNQNKNNTKIGKGNVVEINGYSTIYANGTSVANVGDVSGKPAGIVDKASNPGNLEASTVINKDYKKFEDDTDKAPAIKIKVVSALSREISGTVWEDERTSKVEGAIVGDGEKDNKFINGVTVQLVEITSNGQEFVWREFGGKSTDANGKYTYGQTGNGIGSGLVGTETAIIGSTLHTFDPNKEKQGQYIFTGFMPGKYIVRFIYGDTEKTVIPQTYNNGISYNGQDYKSTTYQKGVDQNSSYEWNRWKWDSKTEEFVKDGNTITTVSGVIVNNQDEAKNYSNNETAITAFTNDNKAYLYDIAKSQGKNVSDAKDIESRRNEVNDYSDNDVRNHIAEVLAVPDSKDSNLLQELIDNTKMTAETGLIVMEFEYNTKTTDNQANDNRLTYVVSDIDLGLEERPKAQLVIDKEVTNMKLTLADGSTLFDARQTATNVAWKEHVQYKTGYENNYRMKKIDAQMLSKERLGLIQVSMDEELMHGAKIRITYNVKVRNVGEIDYKGNQFYYTGTVGKTEKIVTTKANTVIDYVANNLQFDKQETENSNWNVIKKDAITSNTNNDFINYRLKDKVAQFNTIIYTNSLSIELVPELYKQKIDNDSASDVFVPLTLSQLITAENDTDDLTYENIVEIVETSNTVGRRMAYSVVGNQDPTADQPSEADSDIAESVKILPPFGNGGLYIIIATTIMIAMAILAGGIIFIKKKVIK